MLSIRIDYSLSCITSAILRCSVHCTIAILDRHSQRTRCFYAVAELLEVGSDTFTIREGAENETPQACGNGDRAPPN